MKGISLGDLDKFLGEQFRDCALRDAVGSDRWGEAEEVCKGKVNKVEQEVNAKDFNS